MLLATVGVATLLTFNVPQAQPLMADALTTMLDIKDEARVRELRRSFPYGLLQSILLMVVMYLTLLLYHSTAHIRRFYRYLAGLENEIRADLQMDGSTIGFTRESSFYEANRPVLGRVVGILYVAMLGVLLAAFLGYRVYSDFIGGHSSTRPRSW